MKNYKELIALALEEDLGSGDHSALACIPKNAKGKAQLLIKDSGVISGIEIAREVFSQVDKNIEFKALLQDGAAIKQGDIAFTVEGSSISLLMGERLALNYLQRMSGIASHAAELNALISEFPTQLLDTRKTSPGLRYFEKLAVRHGGAKNHRMGLYDMIMIKDNHIDYAGSIAKAITACKSYLKEKSLDLKIEVEARNLNEVSQIIAAGPVDRIMLDNFSFSDLKLAVEMIGNKAETEASGGITRNDLVKYAACGVDFISIGALTHQINSLDMSLKAI